MLLLSSFLSPYANTSLLPLYRDFIVTCSGVGKTSMVAKLMNPSKAMNTNIPATMGIEFDTQVLNTANSGRVKAQLWDTAGQERFARVLLPTYFRKAKGVILVYDITSSRSFESIGERWIKQMEEHTKVEGLCMVSWFHFFF